MASTELLKMTCSIDGNVQDIGNKVQGVDEKVQGIGSDVKDISGQVRGVDDKLNQVNRSFYFQHLLIVPSAQTASQGISSEIVFSDGCRPQTHPLIITLQQKLVITIQLNGSFKAVYSINGNLLTPSYGYTENVRYFRPSLFTKRQLLIISKFCSRIRQKYSLVRLPLTRSILVNLTASISSSIIEDIIALRDAGKASMAYFYFDFRDVDKQKLRNLLPSLLIQLSARSDSCCDKLFRLYSSHDRGVQKPNDRAMIECLKEMLALEAQGPTYIIMDAVDECPVTSTIP